MSWTLWNSVRFDNIIALMFDPYQAWLGIPKEQQPPNFYQLLGISPLEQDRRVIDEAIIRQTARVRIYQNGPQARLCTDILNKIAEAGTVLLDPTKRRRYDEHLLRPTEANPFADLGAAPPAPSPSRPAASRLSPLLWVKIAVFAVAAFFFLSGFALFLVAVFLSVRR
jgi:hypothetical protein